MSERNILQVFNRYLEQGGEESSVAQISNLLAERHSIERFWFDSSEWVGSAAPPRWRQAGLMLHNARFIRAIADRHRNLRADYWLVHNVYPIGSASVYRAARMLDAPIVQYIHNFRPFSVSGYLWANNRVATEGLKKNFWPEIRSKSWQNSQLKTAWLAFVLRYLHSSGAFKAVRSWIAVSAFMKETFVSAGVSADDIFTIPHSWKPRAQEPEQTDLGYYLFVGRLIEEKGVEVLFRTWKTLEKEMGRYAPRLKIAGSGPLSSWVEAQSRLSDRIEFVGQVDGERKQSLISGCKAMLAPSIWWEPLGKVTFEAYDFGKPMLAARSGGLSETVADGATGFLHSPGNHEELASQIIALESDVDSRISMGIRGRQWLKLNTTEERWHVVIDRAVKHALRR